MRLLVTLTSEKNCTYDKRYYHKLHGFLYELQRDSQLFNRHVLEGYKFFSYSNIFPAVDMKHGVEIPTIGTLWKFRFDYLDEQKRKILQLGLESGFGELNSSGFGFLNKVEG